MEQLRLVDPSNVDFIAALKAEGLPPPDPKSAGHVYSSLEVACQVVGYVGIEMYESSGLLRSVVIIPEAKGKGYGAKLVAAAVRQALTLDISELWLLTTTAEGFFVHLGWRIRDRADAPAAVRMSAEFASLCPATATCLSFKFT